MCTGQCAVVDVNSKCWRNMFVLDMCLHGGAGGGVGQLGMAHHQMGQPPRLGCLGMCTGQCAVVDVGGGGGGGSNGA